MKEKRPSSGKIELHGNGMGVPSPEDIERRAREIAMIDERNPDEFTDADWSHAREELMGSENNEPPEETPDNSNVTGDGKSLRTIGVIVCAVPGSTTKKRRWV